MPIVWSQPARHDLRSHLTYLAERQSERADATVTLTRPVLDRLVLRELTIEAAIDQGLVAIAGSR